MSNNQFEAVPIKIDTNSFLIEVDGKFMPKVTAINENLPPETMTHALVSELAYELYYAKSALEDVINTVELLEEENESLNIELSEAITYSEMLRDELDNV